MSSIIPCWPHWVSCQAAQICGRPCCSFQRLAQIPRRELERRRNFSSGSTFTVAATSATGTGTDSSGTVAATSSATGRTCCCSGFQTRILSHCLSSQQRPSISRYVGDLPIIQLNYAFCICLKCFQIQMKIRYVKINFRFLLKLLTTSVAITITNGETW